MLELDVTPSYLGVTRGYFFFCMIHILDHIFDDVILDSPLTDSHIFLPPMLHLKSLISYGAFIILGTSFQPLILSDNINT
jgi:hypothetical protein